MMLNDKDIIPICQHYARIFTRQAKQAPHIGQDATYEELFNEAYATAKPLDKLKGLATCIKGRLMRYIGLTPYSRRGAEYKKRDSDRVGIVDEETPLCMLISKEELEEAQKAFETLTESEKHLLDMRYYQGMSFIDMSEVVGYSPEWTSYLVKAVVRRLRKKIDGKEK
jgi:RNA polymerase sigma factor (sigma-70 family)